jgi:hypothetical protein
MILTTAHVVARMYLGTALAIKDVSSFYGFSAELFAAKSLTI